MSDPSTLFNSADVDAETQAQDRQRFIEFALALVGEDERKDDLTQTLATEWDSKPSAVRNTIGEALAAAEVHLYPPHNAALEAATTLTSHLDLYGEKPSPPKHRLMREYFEVLTELRNVRREIADTYQTLVDGYVTVAGFSATVIALFNGRVVKARQDVEEAHAVLEQIALIIIEMEKLPGFNPRKVRRFSHDTIGREIKQNRGIDEASQPPLEYDLPLSQGNWLLARNLGGGMSQAFLWVDVDPATGLIRQRIVRKDTPVAREQWADATKWYGVDMRGDPKSRIPMEYHTQRAVQDRPEAKYVALALKCEVDVKKLLYRLYLPYCPYGDLADLVERYQRDQLLLPEPMLWRIFECLVETGLIMQRGGITDVPADGWMEIVHRDLKPSNIFMDLPPDTTYPRYPTPKLADFGLAIETWPDDPLNPTIYNAGSGTPGYLAPEQLAYMDVETREPVDEFQLLAHTNVWGIGAIMWSLAHCQMLGYEDDLDYNVDGTKERPVGDARTALLSQDLLDAIQACMKFDPAERITFEALHRGIQDFIAIRADDDGMGQYLQQARMGVQKDNVYFDLSGLPQDDYRIGLAFGGSELSSEDESSGRAPSAGGDGIQQGGAEGEAGSAGRGRPKGFRVPSGSGSFSPGDDKVLLRVVPSGGLNR
ncbi:hypothetical protein LTR85_005614 [Meristemomyces frigidus]|nr:hypothetical protein LTR85_005614 [Meristemomyces frigidus]